MQNRTRDRIWWLLWGRIVLALLLLALVREGRAQEGPEALSFLVVDADDGDRPLPRVEVDFIVPSMAAVWAAPLTNDEGEFQISYGSPTGGTLYFQAMLLGYRQDINQIAVSPGMPQTVIRLTRTGTFRIHGGVTDQKGSIEPLFDNPFVVRIVSQAGGQEYSQSISVTPGSWNYYFNIDVPEGDYLLEIDPPPRGFAPYRRAFSVWYDDTDRIPRHEDPINIRPRSLWRIRLHPQGTEEPFTSALEVEPLQPIDSVEELLEVLRTKKPSTYWQFEQILQYVPSSRQPVGRADWLLDHRKIPFER